MIRIVEAYEVYCDGCGSAGPRGLTIPVAWAAGVLACWETRHESPKDLCPRCIRAMADTQPEIEQGKEPAA